MQPIIKPKILVIGPIFNTQSGPGGVGGKLYLQLHLEGYVVHKRSSYRNKILRMLDIISFAFFRRNSYDIILLQGFGLLAFVMEDAVIRIGKYLKKPIIYTIHGGAFHEFYDRHPRWCYSVLARASVINTPSRFLQEFLTNKGFSVDYLPNFIDFKHFSYNRYHVQSRSLLWVRAFHDIYHPELAIEAVKILHKEIPNIKLTMVGPDQGTRKRCEDLIEVYGLKNNIQMIGYVPNNELNSYYHSHVVFLTTTRYESFGVAMVEAGACGIPCVCIPVGEIPYLWKDQVNILFSERNPQDFADKIKLLLNSPDLRNYISKNAHANAIGFSWEHVLPKWEDLIQNLSK